MVLGFAEKIIKFRGIKMESNRKFIEDVIGLHEMGKNVEQIMFSLNMVYEDEVVKDE